MGASIGGSKRSITPPPSVGRNSTPPPAVAAKARGVSPRAAKGAVASSTPRSVAQRATEARSVASSGTLQQQSLTPRGELQRTQRRLSDPPRPSTPPRSSASKGRERSNSLDPLRAQALEEVFGFKTTVSPRHTKSSPRTPPAPISWTQPCHQGSAGRARTPPGSAMRQAGGELPSSSVLEEGSRLVTRRPSLDSQSGYQYNI